MRFTPALFPRSRSLARSSTHRVTSVSAGPPLLGLYLKPPSSGGLCDGVITMPSARCCLRPRLQTRIADAGHLAGDPRLFAAAVTDEDRPRDDRRRRHAVVSLHYSFPVVGRPGLDRGAPG